MVQIKTGEQKTVSSIEIDSLRGKISELLLHFLISEYKLQIELRPSKDTREFSLRSVEVEVLCIGSQSINQYQIDSPGLQLGSFFAHLPHISKTGHPPLAAVM